MGPLSWEHVPPESAYNDQRIVRASQQQMVTPGAWDGRGGRVEQRGSGAFTLCEACNNNTGSWYGAEYAQWARQALERLQRVPPEHDTAFFVPFRGRPLRFLKQVATMFFSVNAETFADLHPELVKFVLDRRSAGLPPQYRFDLVLVRGTFARSSGVYGTVDVSTGRTDIASEVAHFPFALRLVLSEQVSQRRGAIEHFARHGFDEEREVWLYTIAGHIATKYPGDYRSRDRVEREARAPVETGAVR